ncbi:hypothetical protein HOC80_00300 [archaeon]|jgi:hypothetical protein|nr:hypothetical protein [archaeon]MBT4416525.1 hypothetical protein [archaeon]
MVDDYEPPKEGLENTAHVYAGGNVVLYGHSGPPQEIHPSIRLEDLCTDEVFAVPVYRKELSDVENE